MFLRLRGLGEPGSVIDLGMRAGRHAGLQRSARSRSDQGGAAASVGATKQRRLVFAAQHYLQRLSALPPCRFDVVAIDGEQVQWLQAAFEA